MPNVAGVNTSEILALVMQFLPMLAPALLEGIKKLAPTFLAKLPWYLKAFANALIAAVIGYLTELAGAGGVTPAVVAGATGSLGYFLAREKEPKKKPNLTA